MKVTLKKAAAKNSGAPVVGSKRKEPPTTTSGVAKKVATSSGPEGPSKDKGKGVMVASADKPASKVGKERLAKTLADQVADSVKQGQSGAAGRSIGALARAGARAVGEAAGLLIEAATAAEKMVGQLRAAEKRAEEAEAEKEKLASQLKDKEILVLAADKAEKQKLVAVAERDAARIERDNAREDLEKAEKRLADLSGEQGAFAEELLRKAVRTDGFVVLTQKVCDGFEKLGWHKGIVATKMQHPEVVAEAVPGYNPSVLAQTDNSFAEAVLGFDGGLPLIKYIQSSAAPMSIAELQECTVDANADLVVQPLTPQPISVFERLVKEDLGLATDPEPEQQGSEGGNGEGSGLQGADQTGNEEVGSPGEGHDQRGNEEASI